MTTVTTEQLCRLALAAIDDADSRAVLSDALLEGGRDHLDWSRTTAHVDVIWGAPRIVAGYLLFVDWPTTWPLAEKCRRRLEWGDISIGPGDYEIRIFPPSLPPFPRHAYWNIVHPEDE